MRIAGLPKFRKLYGVIEEPLPAGKYFVRIDNTYDVESFGGTKSLVLANVNQLGGANYFLAYCYLGLGALCIVLSGVFAGLHFKQQPRQ